MKRVHDVLSGSDTPLAALASESARRAALDRLLDGVLDQPFRQHMRVATRDGATLVLCADSPTWAHRARYLAPAILEHLSRNGVGGLAQVSIRVTHGDAEPAPPEPKRAARTLTPAAAAALEGAATAIGDGPLAQRLRSLAKRR